MATPLGYNGARGLAKCMRDSLRLLRKAVQRLLIRTSGRFDAIYYLENNRDVAEEGWDPLRHYCAWGWREMRSPSARFDGSYYSVRYLAKSHGHINPLVHWALIGRWLGRKTQYQEARTFLERANSDWKDYDLVFILHDCSRTGAPIFLLRLLRSMIDKGVVNPARIGVIILGNGPLLSCFCALCDTLLLWLVPTQIRPKWVTHFIGRNPSRLIYINSIAAAGVLELVSQERQRWICHVHEMPSLAGAFQKECSLLEQHCSCYIAVSDESAAVIRDKIGLSDAHISLVSPGVPVRSERGRRRPDSKLHILGCGTTSLRKGTDLFCEIAEALSARGCDFEMRWSGAKGDFDLGRDINSRRLQANVAWDGEQEEMAHLFDWADVFLLPSREDPFPLVALEAGESSVPTICFDERAGGIHAYVEQGAGLVVPYLSVPAMVAAIMYLASQPSVREEMGKKARILIVEKFNLGLTVKNIEKIIQEARGELIFASAV